MSLESGCGGVLKHRVITVLVDSWSVALDDAAVHAHGFGALRVFSSTQRFNRWGLCILGC